MRIGVLGGGQLGRMLALAGAPLGLRMRMLDREPDAVAGHVAELVVGPCDDEAVLERFLHGVDLATYEFENVPLETARAIEARTALFPSSTALEHAQDRLVEKRLFRRLNIPTAEFVEVASLDDLRTGLEATGLPAVLKSRRLGYDGKGQARIERAADAEAAWRAIGAQPAIVEGFVHFEREVSIIAVRSRSGETAFYPLVQNVHREGILAKSIAPAPALTPALQALAESKAVRLLDALGYVGVLAIEFFELSGRLYANEFAPRVHNSGHWTIDAAQTSQFENHLRAILDWPLGPTAAHGHAVMLNLIGEAPPASALLAAAGARVHLYGKAARPGRKLGHVTVCGGDADTVALRAEALERMLGSLSANGA